MFKNIHVSLNRQQIEDLLTHEGWTNGWNSEHWVPPGANADKVFYSLDLAFKC